METPGEKALEVIVGRLLEQREMTLAVAESCTGGLVSHRITNVPGSSAYYSGSITAYSNEIKEVILRVQHRTLVHYGAVSEQTVLEMARGVRDLFQANVGLAVTGIAGPGGGTPEKPVGLVYGICGMVTVPRTQSTRQRLCSICCIRIWRGGCDGCGRAD